jgi:energy-coupling factor transporter transmembrane protein EcfT
MPVASNPLLVLNDRIVIFTLYSSCFMSFHVAPLPSLLIAFTVVIIRFFLALRPAAAAASPPA